MRTLIQCALLSLLLVGNTLAADGPLSQLKRKLKAEVTALQLDLDNAGAQVTQLQASKFEVERGLQDMETWGVAQQADKDQYYTQLSNLSSTVAQEREDAAKTLEKYRRLRKYATYLFGTLAGLLYSRFLAPLLSFAGPWALVGQVGGPIAAYGLGAALSYLLL